MENTGTKTSGKAKGRIKALEQEKRKKLEELNTLYAEMKISKEKMDEIQKMLHDNKDKINSVSMLEQELEKITPMIEKAKEIMKEMSEEQLAEIASYKNPPERIRMCLEAIVLILTGKKKEWKDIKKEMANDFVDRVLKIDWNKLGKRTLEALRKDYLGHKTWDLQKIYKASHAMGPLAEWISAQNNVLELKRSNKKRSPEEVKLMDERRDLIKEKEKIDEQMIELKKKEKYINEDIEEIKEEKRDLLEEMFEEEEPPVMVDVGVNTDPVQLGESVKGESNEQENVDNGNVQGGKTGTGKSAKKKLTINYSYTFKKRHTHKKHKKRLTLLNHHYESISCIKKSKIDNNLLKKVKLETSVRKLKKNLIDPKKNGTVQSKPKNMHKTSKSFFKAKEYNKAFVDNMKLFANYEKNTELLGLRDSTEPRKSSSNKALTKVVGIKKNLRMSFVESSFR